MNKSSKSKKNFALTLVGVVALGFVAVAVASLFLRDQTITRASLSSEISTVGIVGSVSSSTYTDLGCTQRGAFGSYVTTCNKYLQQTYQSSGDFCTDFHAFDKALKEKGYIFMSDNGDIDTCEAYKASTAKFVSYGKGTSGSQTHMFVMYCAVGRVDNPYVLDQQLHIAPPQVDDRSKTYGCVLQHN